MALKLYRPTTPGRRHASVVNTSHLSRPHVKSLREILPNRAGRNAQGKITVRHRGGRSARFFRMVDFLMNRFDLPAEVMALEYDPNRSAHIALIKYPDGEFRYILAPHGLHVGDRVVSSHTKAEIRVGNRLPLEKIPLGVGVYNVELQPGQGGKIVRSAGAMTTLMAVEGDYAQLKLPSGEIRVVSKACMASIGQVSNVEHSFVRLGKAGRRRLAGFRPTVRGKAMNPVDHPHGGGEGHNPIGMKHPKTPWGKPALGVKTRKDGKQSDKFILSRRK